MIEISESSDEEGVAYIQKAKKKAYELKLKQLGKKKTKRAKVPNEVIPDMIEISESSDEEGEAYIEKARRKAYRLKMKKWGERNSKIFKQLSSCEVCGKIKKVHVVNFMCHSNFEFTFGDKINFIIGKNGSGKSAILTALVIGLGGRTSDTNRGQALNQLIKSGCSKALIEITLWNLGPLSYHSEKFGDEITIVRQITEHSSTYKIIPQKGPAIPLKRNQLMAILLNFNIQPTNPVCILNQDMARNFLKDVDSKELYTIFKKGTLLEHIFEKMSVLTNVILYMRATLDRRRQAAADTSKDLLGYKEKLDRYEFLEKLIEKESLVQNELYWNYAISLEKEVEISERNVSENEKLVQEYRVNLNRGEIVRDQLTAKNEQLEKELQDIRMECEKIEAEVTALQQKITSQESLINKNKFTISTLKKKIENEKANCDRITQEIEKKNALNAEYEAKRSQYEQEMSELMKRSAELKAVKQTTDVHKQQLQDTLNQMRIKVTTAKQKSSHLEENLRTKKKFLDHLKSTTSKYGIYGKWMPQFIELIDRAHQKKQFIKKPVGPLGCFIKLRDESWGPAIESILGYGFLQSFCVTNSCDYQVLSAVVRQIQMRPAPTIFIAKFFDKVHDIKKTETFHPKYINLFQGIEISHPVVANLIIDQIRPDTVLLVPTCEECYPLMENEMCIPKNCVKAVTKEGDLFYPSPNYRSYAGQVLEKTKLLQVSTEEAVRTTENEIKKTLKEFEETKIVVQDFTKKEMEAKRTLDKALKDHDKINKQIIACSKRLDQLKELDVQENCANSNNVLQEDLEYRKAITKKVEEDLKKAVVVSEKLSKELGVLKQQQNNFDQQQKQFRQEIINKENEIKVNKNEMKKYTMSHDEFLYKLKSQEERLQLFKNKFYKLKEACEEALRIATEAYPERIESSKSREELEKLLKKLNIEKETVLKEVGHRPEAPRRYEKRLAEFNKTLECLKKSEGYLTVVEAVLKGVTQRYHDLKTVVASSTKMAFGTILELRNFLGGLKIDHVNQTLKICVDPQTNGSKESSVVTTLSGGERSYSMVSFILAIWNNMSSPFYFMDEFDVYMDEVNRKMALKALMRIAKLRAKNQFVFLTPHPVNNESSSDVHIFKMDDPRQLSQQ